jgi:hypothetical protein
VQPPKYVWSDPTRPVSVYLALSVVKDLGIRGMEGLKAVPKRGLEIGGVLLGHSAFLDGRRVISVDGFEAVDSEHRTGPSWQLSELDKEHFGEALRRHPEAVGMFRTQTRGPALEVQAEDAEVFSRYFPAAEALFLLIHPVAKRGAFFHREGDKLTLLHEFPFDAIDLTSEPSVTELAIPPVVPTEAEPERPAPRMNAWAVGTAAVVAGLIGGALLVHYASHSKVQQTAATPAPASQDQSAAGAHVNLKVEPDGTAYRLVWDKNAPAVRDADLAILEINDGNHISKLTLGSRELNSGMVSYWPESKDVTFRLQVQGKTYQTDDSVRAVGGTLAELPAPPPRVQAPQERPPAVVTPAVKPAPPVAPPSKPAVEIQPKPALAPQRGEAARSADSEPHPSPFTSPPPMVAESRPPVTPPAATPAPRELDPEISMDSEPVSGSRVGRVVGKIPLLRRLKKTSQAFVPPTPVHQVRPRLSTRDRETIDTPVEVDVRTYVGEDGKVQYAEVISGEKHHIDLATASVYAARHWEFTPARMGTERMPGEVILHFRFTPPGPPKVAAQARN